MSNNTVIKIPASGTTSNDLNLYNYNAGVAIELPAAASLTGTAFAVHGSIDGTNFKPIYNDNTALSLTAVATTGAIYVISPAKLFGVERIRLVSNGTEGAERTINVVAISPVA